jgi:hypothetical protein
MGSIPLPALDVKAQPQQDILQKYGQLMQLKNMQQQTQMQQQEAPVRQQILGEQAQAGQLANDQAQRQAASTQALMGSFANLDPKDPNYFDKGIQAAQATGKVLPQQLQTMMNAKLDIATKNATLSKTQQEVALARGDALHALGTQYLQQPDPVMAQNWPAVRQKVIDLHQGEPNFNPSTVPEQFPGRDWVQTNTTVAGMSAAGVRAAASQQEADTGKQKLEASMNPQSSLYAPSAASVALGTAPGSAAIQTNAVQQAARKAGAEESARMPGEMALARQRQALSQGDPRAAAQLLVDGDATLSELKARGATPDFIARSLFAAKQLSAGKYNAQSADAAFQVAKSPANVAFFGSAKSLTDPGGTLDQLTAAAKDIPGGKIPVFNTVADWEKAAAGSGPIAKYASIALGASDDYSKVMSGGQGSDSSRTQALNLFGASMSPDQRAGSIQGVRGAVGSQIKSRIGNNPVLGRMYGSADATPQNAPQGGGITVTAPNGKSYSFKDQQSADAFKQKAGIQ